MTSRYDIIQAWVSSCTTEEQFEAIKDFVNNRLKCENEKELEDIIDMVCENFNKREFLRSKVLAVRPVYSEPQPTDTI